MTISTQFNWLAWHRRLGLITCFGILMWGISGMAHPIMTHLQPVPASFSPPPQSIDLHDALTINRVLAENAIEQVQRITVVSLNNKSYYRVGIHSNEPARYFFTQSGLEMADGDKQYAESLASHYTGLPQDSIVGSRLITRFDNDYNAVNQLLPVWRVEFAGDEHLRAFIDTDQARLGTLVDDTRYNLTRLFTLGHNWSFLNDMPWLQVSVMALVLCMALYSASSGLFLYFSRRRNVRQRLANNPLKRWHRRLGLLIALTTLVFVSSGAFHLAMSFQQARNIIKMPASEQIATSQISEDAWLNAIGGPLARIDLIISQGKPMWLVRPATGDGQNAMPRAQVAVVSHEHHHHDHMHHEEPKPQTLLIDAGGTAADAVSDLSLFKLAQSQAASYAGLELKDVAATELVTGFNGEYGFIFKRLPVVKVQFKAPGNPRYYIESATGALAAKVRDIDAVEGYTFGNFHKWSLGGLINTDFRDVMVMLFALGNILVALMGLVLFSRRR